jgi:hypothetical protein
VRELGRLQFKAYIENNGQVVMPQIVASNRRLNKQRFASLFYLLVIGGAAGAAPPLLGWCAMTGEVHPYALLLFLLIFVWTPPHFWALAIARRDEYAKVNIPMLPINSHWPRPSFSCERIRAVAI